MIVLRVLYLGGSRVQAGCSEESLALEDGATVADAARRVAERHPDLASRLSTCRWARNFELAGDDEPLADGDELALVPPVSGGAPRTWITRDTLSVDEVLNAVRHPGAGGTVLFVGTVRDNARGAEVARLEYEAYVPMVERQLERIAARCEANNPGARLAIAHRYGSLEVGEISVVIAAAAPHRAEAFHACRQALEAIKVDVPIFKREITASGEEWVGWGGG